MSNFTGRIDTRIRTMASVALKAQIDDLLHDTTEVNKFIKHVNFTSSFPYKPHCFAELVTITDKRLKVYTIESWNASSMGRDCPTHILLLHVGLYVTPVPVEYAPTPDIKLIHNDGKLWVRKLVERELPVTKRAILTHIVNEYSEIIEHEIMENLLVFDERLLRPHD